MNFKGIFAAMAALAILAGCGNDPNAGVGAKIAGGYLKGLTGKKAKPQPAVTDPAAYGPLALKAVKGPVMLGVVEKRNAVAILGQKGRNGPYVTWTSLSRQTVTLKHGILTATRGLGDDLMNAEVDSVSALIHTRRAGEANRVMYFLDGESKTYRLVFRCTVSPGQLDKLALGKNRITARRVSEACAADDLSFQNTYWVGSDGWIWQSRQWVSPGVGYLVAQQLRR